MKIQVVVLLAALCFVFSTAEPVYAEPRCSHDTAAMQRYSYYNGMDRTVPVSYDDTSATRHFHELTIANMRIVVSTLDVTNTSRTCQSVGQVIPDFQGGTVTCTAADLLNQTGIDLILNTLLPGAVARHSDRLKVTPATSNIVVPFGNCDPFAAPSSHSSTGVANADLVLYVSAAKTSGSTVAWAGACATDQAGRPIAGVINIGSQYLFSYSTDLLIRTMTHELTHVLGFNSYWWTNLFVNRPTTMTTTLRGKSVEFFNGSNVVSAAQSYFSCSSIQGGEIEDQGGSGTAGSHWEQRSFRQEMMNGQVNSNMFYSNFTLSLLADSGFYFPDYTLAEPLTWAKNIGCGLTNNKCNVADGGLGKLFCIDTTVDACQWDFMAVGQCVTNTFSSALPSYFQYFSNPNVGGPYTLMDYCPIIVGYTNRQCNVSTTDTSDPTVGTYYGPGGRCLATSNLIQSGQGTSSSVASCMKVRCLGSRVQFATSTSAWTDCPTNGSAGTVNAPSGYTGTVTCPPAASICTSDITTPDTTQTTYTCPDSTVAANQSSCSCFVFANITTYSIVAPQVSGSVQTTTDKVFSLTATAQYRSNCSVPDLSAYLKFSWQLQFSNGTNVTLSDSMSKSAILSFPKSWFLTYSPPQSFIATVTISGVSQSVTITQNFSVSTPTPTVFVGSLGAYREVHSTNVYLPATIVDAYFNATLAQWSCMFTENGSSCPSVITTALASNGSSTGVTIGGPIPIGKYSISLTYRSVSATVNISVVDNSVPQVFILLGTTPIVTPNFFVATQTVYLTAASSSSASNLTFQWYINGVASNTTRTIAIDASQLQLSSATSATAQAVKNLVRVQVNVSQTSGGVAEFTLYAAPVPSASVVITNVDHPGTAASAQSDRIQLALTSGFTSAPFGLQATVRCGYFDRTQFGGFTLQQLPCTPSGGNYIATAPYVYTTTSTANVTFQMFISYGSTTVATAQGTFNVTVGSSDSQIATQITITAAATSIDTAISAIAQLLAMVRTATSSSQISSAASTILTVLQTYLVDASALSVAQQSQALDILSVLANFATHSVLTTSGAVASIVSMLEMLVASSSFSIDNAQKAVNALAQLGSSNTNTTVSRDLVKQILNNAPLGQTSTTQSGGTIMTVLRFTGDSARGTSMQGNGSTITVPSNFVLSGMSDSTIVGFSSVTYSTNPYTAIALLSDVVSIDLSLDGTTQSISGLTTPLEITITVSNPSSALCRFWNTTSSAWESTGLTKTNTTSTTITCSTTHLTSFAAASSASAAAYSLVIFASLCMSVLSTM